MHRGIHTIAAALLFTWTVCSPLSAVALGNSEPKPVEDPTPVEDPAPEPANPYTLGAGNHPGNNRQDVFYLTVGAESRTYRVHAPTNYNNRVQTPVVLAFHGGGADQFGGFGLKLSSRLDTAADTKGFIVVYPDALPTPTTTSAVWNADDDTIPGLPDGTFHVMPARPVARDVDFVRALVEDLATKFNINRARIYATGHSNGAQMAYRLACEASDLIAAIAPVGATGLVGAYWNEENNIALDPGRCEAARNVPILHIHGSNDWCVIPDATTSGGCLTTMDILAKQVYPSDRYFAYIKSSKRQEIRDEVRSTVVPVLSDHRLTLPASFASTLAAKFFSPSLSLAEQIEYFRSQITLSRTVGEHAPLVTNVSTISLGTPYLQHWADAAGCQASTITATAVGTISAERKAYTNCNGGGKVELLYLLGHGHTWPGGTNKDFTFCDTTDAKKLELCELYVESIMGKVPSADINSLIWEFFGRYSL